MLLTHKALPAAGRLMPVFITAQNDVGMFLLSRLTF